MGGGCPLDRVQKDPEDVPIFREGVEAQLWHNVKVTVRVMAEEPGDRHVVTREDEDPEWVTPPIVQGEHIALNSREWKNPEQLRDRRVPPRGSAGDPNHNGSHPLF